MRGPALLAVTLGAVLIATPAADGPGAPPSPGSPADARIDEAAARILGAALADGRAHARLTYLCDRIGHRLSGSASLDAAIRWTAGQLGADGLARVHTEAVMVPHWERGTASVKVTAPTLWQVAVLALGGSVPTPDEGITAEVVEVSSFDELKSKGEVVRGKIVLFNREIVANGGEDRGYGSAVGLRVRGAVEAAKLGAVATLVRSLGTADFRLPHTGAMRYQDGVPRIPSAAIAAEDALHMHRLLAAGERVVVEMRLGCRILPDAPSANVLADLRGRERPDEVVLIGAHLDSWDVGCGAHDDGAGVVIVLEAMRLLRSLGLTPRRTVRAVLFTNEENGLAGGKGYAAAHAAELASHVAAIESDSGGARPIGFGVTAGEGGLAQVRRLVRPLAALGADEVVEGGGGADIGPLRPAGVPQISLRQDTTRYFDYHHTEADTVDKVDPHDLSRNAAALAVLAFGLAEMEGRLAPPPPEDPEHGSD